MVDLEMKVSKCEGYSMEYEINALSKEVADDLERFEISKFSIIGNLAGIGEDRLKEYKKTGESFGVLDNTNNYVMIFRFKSNNIIITDFTILKKLHE